jgi:hypothetical protein
MYADIVLNYETLLKSGPIYLYSTNKLRSLTLVQSCLWTIILMSFCVLTFVY